MAQKVQVVLVDDLDGGPADETVVFGLDGTAYEIDLSVANAAAMRAALEPYTRQARRLTVRRGTRSAGRATPRSANSEQTQAIRAWARQTGLSVSERGRISAEVRKAYDAAH